MWATAALVQRQLVRSEETFTRNKTDECVCLDMKNLDAYLQHSGRMINTEHSESSKALSQH